MFKPEVSEAVSMAVAVLSAMLVSAVFIWRLIPFLKRINVSQTILEDAPERHKEKSGTPTMGGIGIILGILCGSGVICIFAGFSADLAICVAATAIFGFIGFIDDFTKVAKKRNLGLTARQKLLLQLAVSLCIALYYVFLSGHGTETVLPFVFKRVDLGYFIIPYIMFIVVAMVNAVNLTDGLDGLAGSVSTCSALFFPVLASCVIVVSGVSEPDLIIQTRLGAVYPVALFFMTLAGACLGFLIFNRHPAKIFMGDTGSLALGGGLAAAAIMTHTELFLPLVGMIFVLEALSDILQVASYKLRGGKRIFKMAPLHHHFELSGWSEKKVVTIFVTVTVVLGFACAAASWGISVHV